MTEPEPIHQAFDFLLNSKACQEDFQNLLEDLMCVGAQQQGRVSWIGKALTAGRFDVALLLSDAGFEIPETVDVLDADNRATSHRTTRDLIRSLDHHFEEKFGSGKDDVYSLNLFLWTGILFQLPNGEVEESVTWVAQKDHLILLNDFYYGLNYSWNNQDGIDFWDYFFSRKQDHHAFLTGINQNTYDNIMSCFPKALSHFLETSNGILKNHSMGEKLDQACAYLKKSSPKIFDEIQSKTGDFIDQNFNDLYKHHIASLVNGLVLNSCTPESLTQLQSFLKMSPITYALIMDDPLLLQTAIQHGFGKDYVAPRSYIKGFSFEKLHSPNVNLVEILYWHTYVGASNERLTKDELANFFKVCAYAVNHCSLWQTESPEKINVLHFLKTLDFKGKDDWVDENVQENFHKFFEQLVFQEELKCNVKENKSTVKSLPSFAEHRF